MAQARIGEYVPKYNSFFFPAPGSYRAYVEAYWWKRMTVPNQEEFLERVAELTKRGEAYLTAASREDKELLQLGRAFYKLARDSDNYDHREDVFSEFKTYMSEVRKAERTILAAKGFTIDSNMADVVEIYQKERAALEVEAAMVSSTEHWNEVLETVRIKKEKLQIIGKTIEQRSQDFAKLNYLMQYKALDTPHNTCGLPDEGRQAPAPDRPPVAADKKMQLLKLKAKALKLKLKLLEI
jgi:hypothetical protein